MFPAPVTWNLWNIVGSDTCVSGIAHPARGPMPASCRSQTQGRPVPRGQLGGAGDHLRRPLAPTRVHRRLAVLRSRSRPEPSRVRDCEHRGVVASLVVSPNPRYRLLRRAMPAPQGHQSAAGADLPTLWRNDRREVCRLSGLRSEKVTWTSQRTETPWST